MSGFKTHKRYFSGIVSYMIILAALVFVSFLLRYGGDVPAAALSPAKSSTPEPTLQYDWNGILKSIFEKRDSILLKGTTEELKAMYALGERNSRWAYELEVKRAEYLKDWGERQGAQFKSATSSIEIKRVRKVGRGYAFYAIVSTEYVYAYEDTPETDNVFRVGTYHSLDLIPGAEEGSWIISREWYLDPFQDSLNHEAFEGDEVKQFVLSQSPRDFSAISEGRKKAAEYADRWAGAASDGTNGYGYNPDYPNYNGRGGDCSNYISQALHEGGFKTGGGWTYSGNSGSRAWCNASGLANYLIWSGRGYQLIKGTYNKVYKEAYKLIPGDVIAYQEKGKVVHNAIVTAADSKGYPLVNTHTTDRYHVPWDLGWNDSDIKFILIKMNYPS
ncbi:MAG: amidase domain-containing protein [Burkholderiales bacterium]